MVLRCMHLKGCKEGCMWHVAFALCVPLQTLVTGMSFFFLCSLWWPFVFYNVGNGGHGRWFVEKCEVKRIVDGPGCTNGAANGDGRGRC